MLNTPVGPVPLRELHELAAILADSIYVGGALITLAAFVAHKLRGQRRG
jgi:hypothetical protein